MVRATGMVRRMDELGRIVLPVELRRTMELEDKDPVEIFVDGDRIILQKYTPCCVFCGCGDGVQQFKGKNVCQSCRDQLRGHAP